MKRVKPFWRRAMATATALVVASGGLFVAGPAEASVAALAARCYKTKSSTMYLNSVSNEYEFVTHFTQSNQVVVDPPFYFRKNTKNGYVAVHMLACKPSKKGAWKALTYSTSTNLKDIKLIISGRKVDTVPMNNDHGFGIMVQRVTKSTVEFKPLVCTKSPAKLTVLGAIKFVTGLPLPVSPSKAVGAWVVENSLKEQDDKYECGLLGKITAVPFKFNSAGVAQLKMPSLGRYSFFKRATWEEVCPPDRYCGISRDDTMTVRAGIQR